MNRKAFTLIELMVTISIIAMLTTIALPVYNRMILKARSDEAKAVIQSIVFAQERFRQENGSFYVDSTNIITNENEIGKNLKINQQLSNSNNFNYSIEGLADGNFTIRATLRANGWGICNNNINLQNRCKQNATPVLDNWVTQWNNRGVVNNNIINHSLEFKYPNRLDNEFTEGGISYENLHTGD